MLDFVKACMRIGLLLYMLGNSIVANAQDSLVIDSLQTIIKKHPSDTLVIDAYRKIAQQWMDVDLNKSLQAIQSSMPLIDKIKDRKRNGLAFQNIGIAYDIDGNLDSALHYLQIAKTIFLEIHDLENQASVLNDIGLAWMIRGNNEMALRNHIEAYEIRKPLNVPRDLGQSLNNLGLIYRRKKDYAKSIEYYRQSLEIKEQLHDESGIINTLINLSSVYLASDQPDSAYTYSMLCLNLAKKLGKEKDIVFINSNIAAALVNMKRLGEAEPIINDVIQQSETKGYAKILAVAYETKGDFERLSGRLNAAETNYAKGLKNARSSNQVESEIVFLKKLGLTALQDLNFKKAYDLQSLSSKLKDSIYNIENAKHANELSIAFETGQKQKTIEQLTLQSKLLEQESAQRAKERNYMIMIALSLAVIGGIIYQALKINRKTNAILNEKNKIIEDALIEKNTLIKEIHHRIKNNLQLVSSLLNLQSYFVKDEHAQDVLRDGRNRVQSMALIHQNLYQEEHFKSIKIQDYFDKLIENLFQSYNIRPGKIQIKKRIEDLTLDIETIIPVGLILNELITNSLKYAFPNDKEGWIEITIAEVDRTLQIHVSDNGIGLPDHFLEKRKNTFGWNMITDFLAKLKGNITFDSVKGTNIRITISNYKPIII